MPFLSQIEDSPHFPHRGVMLDTARNFIPIPDILEANIILEKITFTRNLPAADRQPELLQAERLPLAPHRLAELPSSYAFTA